MPPLCHLKDTVPLLKLNCANKSHMHAITRLYKNSDEADPGIANNALLSIRLLRHVRAHCGVCSKDAQND